MTQERFQEICLFLGLVILAVGVGLIVNWHWGLLMAGVELVIIGLPKAKRGVSFGVSPPSYKIRAPNSKESD